MPPSTPTMTPQPSAAPSFGPRRLRERAKAGAFDNLITAAFFLMLIIAAGIFGYRYFLQQQLTTLQTQLLAEEARFRDPDYSRARTHDRSVRAAIFLLEERTNFVSIFDALEGVVTNGLHYQSFEATLNESGDYVVTLGGLSEEFARIASEVRTQVGTPIFANTTLQRVTVKPGETSTRGGILFNVVAQIDKATIAWKGMEPTSSAVQSTAAANTGSPDTVADTATTTASTTPTAPR